MAKEGRFKEALKAYQTYLSRYKKQGKEREAAEYNVLVIRAHHEDVVIPEFQPKKSLSSSLKSSIQAFLKKYPRNPNRPFLLRVLSFRRGVSTRDISSYRKYSRLSREERKLLDEAEMLIQARSGSTSVKKKLIKNNRPGRSYTELQKTALGKTAYNFLAGDYRNYQQTKISYTPSAFAKSLEKKLSRLEKLEKEYLKVVQYGDREYSLLSLVRISEMYRTLANDIRKSPENKKELEGFAAPLEQKANEFVKLCLDKATELRLAGGSLSQCRKLNYEHKIDRSYIHLVKALKPQWLPSNYAKSKFKLLNLASSSFKKTNFGSYLLAVNQMKRTGELRESYVEESVKNMQGLLDWRYSKGQLAERSFRQVALDSGDKDLRRVAVKNLAALALKVGDASTASDILDEYRGPKDFEIELFRGVSKVASGQYKDAIGHLNTAYKNSRGSEAVALYNKALAQFALNQKSEAIKTMNLYLARARPSSGDISRTILRDWRKK